MKDLHQLFFFIIKIDIFCTDFLILIISKLNQTHMMCVKYA